MAFPRDTGQVVSFLRVIHTVNSAGDTKNSIFMAPPPDHAPKNGTNYPGYFPDSPPIAFDMLDHFKETPEAAQGKTNKKLGGRKRVQRDKNGLGDNRQRKSGSHKFRIQTSTMLEKPSGNTGAEDASTDNSIEDTTALDSSDRSNNSSESQGSNESVASKTSKKGTPGTSRSEEDSKKRAGFVPRIRLSKPQLRASDRDLELIEEEGDGSLPQMLSTRDSGAERESYAIPGGLETDIDTSAVHTASPHSAYTLSSEDPLKDDTGSKGSRSLFDSDSDSEDDEDDDYDDGADGISSSDSAFTDIEADSEIDSSLLYPFDASSGFPFDSNVIDPKRSRRKKRLGSYGDTNDSSATASKNHSQVGSVTGILPLKRSKSFQIRGQLQIEKIEPRKTSNEKSNLSSLIASRAKTGGSPLDYYDFVGKTGENQVKISIFLPPSTSLSLRVDVNSNVAVSDCIGYVLLKLVKEKHKTISSDLPINPNWWRLELVDEDGENYGSFGILDRTRLLSSYNNPPELALCQVSNEPEFKRNDQQSPLPAEVAHALEEMQNGHDIVDETSPVKEGHGILTEVKVLRNIQAIAFPQYEIFSIFVPAYSTVQETLNEYCSLHGLDPSRHNLREMFAAAEGTNRLHGLDKPDPTNPTAWEMGRVLGKTEIITGSTDAVELLADENNMISVGNETFLNAGITPALTSPLRTSPNITERLNSLAVKDLPAVAKAEPTKKAAPERRKNTQKNQKDPLALDEIITGRNGDLPANLNSVYFKWKVWRRKPTLLNRIEKSLIIDGDYIHLAPSDEAEWKVNPTENSPLTGIQASSTHHHHLHQYNYSNYQHKLMMKTSSFHVTQIVKVKRYPHKRPNHFKIVVSKPGEKSLKERDTNLKKKYDLEASSSKECEEIVDKIKWALQVYNSSSLNA